MSWNARCECSGRWTAKRGRARPTARRGTFVRCTNTCWVHAKPARPCARTSTNFAGDGRTGSSMVVLSKLHCQKYRCVSALTSAPPRSSSGWRRSHRRRCGDAVAHRRSYVITPRWLSMARCTRPGGSGISSTPSTCGIFGCTALIRPALVRNHAKMAVDGPVHETWRLGYLIDTIYLRDLWMHRVDSAHALGQPLELSADHDGRIVADVVAEWALRHGQPFVLELAGPVGATYVSDPDASAAEHDSLDAVAFCRT